MDQAQGSAEEDLSIELMLCANEPELVTVGTALRSAGIPFRVRDRGSIGGTAAPGRAPERAILVSGERLGDAVELLTEMRATSQSGSEGAGRPGDPDGSARGRRGEPRHAAGLSWLRYLMRLRLVTAGLAVVALAGGIAIRQVVQGLTIAVVLFVASVLATLALSHGRCPACGRRFFGRTGLDPFDPLDLWIVDPSCRGCGLKMNRKPTARHQG